jgi:protein-disulfide isomerase
MPQLVKWIWVPCVLLAECGAVVVWNAARYRSAMFEPVDAESSKLVFDPQGHIEGNVATGYKVVEFGDFQCPPCRQMCAPINEMSRSRRHGFAFEFRQNPLPMHAYAEQAAALSEAVPKGRFWSTHDMLYDKQPDFSQEFMDKLQKSLGVSGRDLSKAKELIFADERAAEALRLNSTPTFFMIDPNGKVYKVQDPMQIPSMIDVGS